MNSNLLTLDDLCWILDEFVLGFYIDKGCDVFDIGHINVFIPDDSRFLDRATPMYCFIVGL